MSDIIFNGESYDVETVDKGLALMSNDRVGSHRTTTREEMIRSLGMQYDGDRDIYSVLGYPEEISAIDYRARYERQDVAQRIIELPADDTWRQKPRVIDGEDADTGFSNDIDTLDQQQKLFHYLRRVDIASGIGEYGLLLIGLEDGQALSEPPNEGALSGPEDVAYFTPFAQDMVEDWTLGKEEGKEPTDERYNLPTEYELDFSELNGESSDSNDIVTVHWKRIVPIAEGKVESDLKGEPRLKAVFNRLIDREKVLGSSAEMFWTGAAPRFHFNTDTDSNAQIPDDEIEKLDDEVQRFVHEMQSYIKTFDTDVDVIGGEEVDPRGVIEEIDSSIAGQTGIPLRVLKGSERGELASSQDRANWFDRVRTRQHRFAEPEVLRKVVDRLVSLGVVTPPQNDAYEVDWPNLFELNELEEGELHSNRAATIQSLAPGGDPANLPGSTADILEYVETGEFPDSLKSAASTTNAAFNADYSEGEKVMIDGTEAVITGVLTSEFRWIDDETVEASTDDPVYVIATVDGIDKISEDEISGKGWETDVEAPEEDVKDKVEANADIIGNAYSEMDDPHDLQEFYIYARPITPDIVGNSIDTPGIGFDSWPDSWEKADKPARLIALDAWSSMGGTFTGCTREMRGKMSKRRRKRFCAAFKDEILQTEMWRRIQS